MFVVCSTVVPTTWSLWCQSSTWRPWPSSAITETIKP